MGKVITFAIQKGGCGKSITAGTIAYLLAEQGHKVLLADWDGQGNSTELLTLKPIRDYRADGVGGALQAAKDGDARSHILTVTDNLHLLPANEVMGSLTEWMFTTFHGNRNTIIKTVIDSVKDYYDYVICDTAPALDFILTNVLTASDGVVALYETSKFCYSALLSFMETVEAVQAQTNPNLKLIGILPSMLDSRRVDNKEFLEISRSDFGDKVFKSIIHRQAATGRLPIAGFFNNPEIKTATKQYQPVLEELLERV